MDQAARASLTPEDRQGLTTQQRIVLEALEAGKTLTNVVALTCYGIGSLSSRIAELRRMKVPITDGYEVDRFERRFKKYKMAEAQWESDVPGMIDPRKVPDEE